MSTNDRLYICHSWVMFVLFILLTSCYTKNKPMEGDVVDFPQLKEKGEITAVTLYSSTSYFLYRMEPMGYEYELIQDFATANDLKLNVVVAESQEQMIEMLQVGKADVVAYPIVFKRELMQQALYCGREELSSQVLVQHIGPGVKPLTDVTQLLGKEVYVKQNTPYYERLKNLDVELGGGILIREIDKDSLTTEDDLVEMVSTGAITYTISDDKVARLNKTYYWNIDVSLQISFQQRSSWIVRKSSPQLAEAINKWASDNVGERSYKATSKRYFEMSKKVLELSLPAIKDGHISPYDELFRKYAKKLNWDWMLLASVSYQESHFIHTVVSWAGAQGLMGIMPRTAATLKIPMNELEDPDVNIRAGTEVMRIFRDGFKDVTDTIQLIKLTLASYNAGIGHIQDAQRLAEKYGKSPVIWDDNVAEFILLKREPVYYNDSVCKFGYLRGSETYSYVREIIGRYEYYKQQLPIKK